jgi:hypothetical protein
MNIDISRSTIQLARDGLISLRNARGTRIFCQSGSLWVTQEAEIKDLVLVPGDSLTISNGGLTVITALQPSALALRACDPVPARRPQTAGRIQAGPELVACD